MKDQKDYEAIYQELIGFTPPRIRHRIRAGLECDPELLDMVEALRDRAMYPESMDVKTAQMILFAVLLSHVSPAAEFHARGAMRAGATKKELHDVAGLAFLFRGLAGLQPGGGGAEQDIRCRREFLMPPMRSASPVWSDHGQAPGA